MIFMKRSIFSQDGTDFGLEEQAESVKKSEKSGEMNEAKMNVLVCDEAPPQISM